MSDVFLIWVPIQNEFCGPRKVKRSHKDDLLHPAQPAVGHDVPGSHLGHVAQLIRSLNFMRFTQLLLN